MTKVDEKGRKNQAWKEGKTKGDRDKNTWKKKTNKEEKKRKEEKKKN